MPAEHGAGSLAGLPLSAFREGDEEVLLDLERAATEPHQSFVYDDEASARAASRLLLAEGAAEFAPPHCSLARDDGGRVVGMIACLSRADLGRQRLRSAMILRRAGVMAEGTEAARRAALASVALLKPRDGDLYLSHIAVLPEHRGHGAGKLLLAEVVRIARARGAARVVLEVSPSHREATALYLSRGFADEGTAQVTDPASGRVLAYRHMALAL